TTLCRARYRRRRWSVVVREVSVRGYLARPPSRAGEPGLEPGLARPERAGLPNYPTPQGSLSIGSTQRGAGRGRPVRMGTSVRAAYAGGDTRAAREGRPAG